MKLHHIIILSWLFATASTLPALDLGKIGVKKGKDGGKPFNFAAPPADQSAEFVHKSAERDLKNLKKVAIVNFLVEFATVREAKVMSSRPGQQSVSEARFSVPEPDLARYQKITDALYDRFVADLSAAGIEVMPHETLRAERKYQDFKKVQHDSPWATSTKDGRSVFVGAKGMPVYMDNPERASALKGMGMSLGMAFGQNPTLLEVKLSHEIKTSLVSVNLVVDFADMKTSKFLGETSIQTTYDQYLHGDNTRLRFTGVGSPNGPSLRLKHGLLAEHSPFMNFKEGKWQFQGDLLDRLVSDTVTKTRSVSYEYSADTYYRNSERLGQAALGMFLAEICRTRGVSLPASASQPVP